MHSLETEKIVLSGIMQHDGALEDVSFLQPDHFFSPANALLYEAIKKYEANGGTLFDYLSMSAAMTSMVADAKKGISYRKKFEEFELRGVDWYLGEIFSIPSVKVNLIRYATIVQEYATRRELIRVGNSFSTDISSISPVSELVEAATSKLMAVSTLTSRKKVEYAEELTANHIATMETRLSGTERAYKTGLKDLDEALNGGLCGGDLIVVGARPGMGKTALALCVDLAVSSSPDEDGILRNGVLHFSMEMQNIRNTDRIISQLGKVDSRKIKNGLLTERDFDGMTAAYSKFINYPFAMYDKAACRLHDIVSQSNRVKKEFESKGQRLSLICIDYIQLMGSENKHAQRNTQIEEITRGLKGLAKDLNVPVLALSQFNRSADKERRPSIAQLRDSGSIEQDADIILFPYREEQDDPDTEMTGYADLYVAKNRNGPLAHIGMCYEAEYTRFSDWDGVVPSNDKPEKTKWKK